MAKISNVNLPRGIVYPNRWSAFIATFKRIYTVLLFLLAASKEDIEDIEARLDAIESRLDALEVFHP